MQIFISFSHQQIDWVKNRLVPCLTAGGAEIIIDYLKSACCQHEMQRAIAKDLS